MTTTHATQPETDAYRDATRDRFVGFPVVINSNGPGGLHVRCTICGSSATRNPEMWIREHSATHLVGVA